MTDTVYDPTQNSEHLLLAKNDEQAVPMVDAPGPLFGDIPVVVLRAPELPYLRGLPHHFHQATITAIDQGMKEFAAESTSGTVITVQDTGHNIHEDQPEVVMDAILDVLAG